MHIRTSITILRACSTHHHPVSRLFAYVAFGSCQSRRNYDHYGIYGYPSLTRIFVFVLLLSWNYFLTRKVQYSN